VRVALPVVTGVETLLGLLMWSAVANAWLTEGVAVGIVATLISLALTWLVGAMLWDEWKRDTPSKGRPLSSGPRAEESRRDEG